MKARFLEILQENQRKLRVTNLDLKGQSKLSTFCKFLTIKTYEIEYHLSPGDVGEWLDMHHSSVIYLRDRYRPPKGYEQYLDKIELNDLPGKGIGGMRIKDYSGFVSFGYKKKVRFKYKYA